MRFLKEITGLPTAPFAEGAVQEYVRQFVAARPKLKLRRDAIGNLLIELRGQTNPSSIARWVFSAHMDHPGMRVLRTIDARTIEAAFHGYVQIDYVRGTKVRFFSGGEEVTGVVIDAKPDDHDRLTVPKTVRVKVSKPVAAGSPGMFDQGVGRVRGHKFFCRALDDLGGVAAALTMIDQLAKKPPKVTVAVMLTRAEEDGFVGCIGAVLNKTLLRKTDHIIGIETSAEQPYARQGDGVILRVGDRTSIFHSGLTYFLNAIASDLAKRNKKFRFQRALMPGGTCESTVYDAFGYISAAVCVPLGNYHNMDKAKQKIGPEYIDLRDWNNMVKLFIAIAQNAHTYTGPKLLQERIAKRYKKYEKLL